MVVIRLLLKTALKKAMFTIAFSVWWSGLRIDTNKKSWLKSVVYISIIGEAKNYTQCGNESESKCI